MKIFPRSWQLTTLSLILALCAASCSQSRSSQRPSSFPSHKQKKPSLTPISSDSFPDAPGQISSSFPKEISSSSWPPSSALDISAAYISGVWGMTIGADSCRVATSQTRVGERFRAGPLRCSPPLDRVRSWVIEGKVLVFYDEEGDALARLYQISQDRLEGYSKNGEPVFLIR